MLNPLQHLNDNLEILKRDQIDKHFIRFCRIIVLMASFCASFPAASQKITVTGQWDVTINSTNLQAGPGSNLIDTYQSAVNQVLIDIKAGPYGNTWMVNVHKQDALWDMNLHLDIKRQPNGNLTGGLNYFELTSSDQNFFWSTLQKNIGGIEIQFQLRGMSVDIPVNTYSTTIYYTMVDM